MMGVSFIGVGAGSKSLDLQKRCCSIRLQSGLMEIMSFGALAGGPTILDSLWQE